MIEETRKPIVVAISGGFDPIHIGHVRYIQEAKKLGDVLVVILNNDNWLRMKKGHVFMPQHERKEIIESIACVNRVIFSLHENGTTDYSVCNDLRVLRPDIFANGGDRHGGNIPEYAVCEEIGCAMVFNIGAGGKVQSSSWLEADCAKAGQKKSNEIFQREIAICRKLHKEKQGCSWGSCRECGVIPLLHKLYKNTFLEKDEDIIRAKQESFNGTV
jgi:D-beta-D-heptose 7-phosphate kinase/D-beta-D-heptose 1-phosphate adenosyltransferase